MKYVLNSSTITFNDEYTDEFFAELKEKLQFPYEVLLLGNNETIVKDMLLDDKTSNEDFINAVNLQDYDVRQYVSLMLSSFLSIFDVSDINYGTTNDYYFFKGIKYSGDQYSFVELAYENDWCIISLEPIQLDCLVDKAIKNGSENKKIYEISDSTQFYLEKSLNSENSLGRYFSSFEKVYCVKNCSFFNWSSIEKTGRFKVLSTFYREIEHVIHNEFDKLGHFPGRNSNRVEKIGDNLFEYRLSNPNYRIYYTRRDDNFVILLSMLKKRGKISSSTMNNLMRLKDCEYEKI